MIYRRQLLAGLALSTALVALPALGEEQPSMIVELIVDNGGTVKAEGSQDLITNVLGSLANLHGRSFNNARIDLILTSHPTTVWSGSPRDLLNQANAVLDQVKINDRCSDVERAFHQADQNLRVAAPKEAHLIVVSPLIAAPFPCNQGPAITLPQPVPQGIALGKTVSERNIATLTFFGVHPSQERVWTDYLESEGILAGARKDQLDLTFLGLQQSLNYMQRSRILIRARSR